MTHEEILTLLGDYVDYLIANSSAEAPMWNIEKVRSGKPNKWNYIDGCMITACLSLYKTTGDANTPAADEIGTLTRDVDAMLGQIDTLIHENYEKQLLLQDTRYKMLQDQINPHFLYNTLSTLSWLVRAGKNEDAGRLIINLGDMLRAMTGW